MQMLWTLGHATVGDVAARMEEPKPKYTTVATFFRILENKGFVTHVAEGKSYRFYPLVEREEYARRAALRVLTSYFDGSLAQLVSCVTQQTELPAGEAEAICDMLRR